MRWWVPRALATGFWKQRQEIKRLNKALSQAEQTIFELEDDRDLMIRKFDEDLENACASYRIGLQRSLIYAVCEGDNGKEIKDAATDKK